MAGIRQRKNGTWEYIYKKAGLLDKPIYMTFNSKEEGDAYTVRLEKLLDQGIIPSEHQAQGQAMNITGLVREYERDAHPSDKDKEKLAIIVREHGTRVLANITAAWVDDWITSMKRVDKLAPSTIRARVGALARCTDWGMRKGYVQFPDHPLRSLPDGYAQYTVLDIALAGVEKVDVERDRRLEAGEYAKIIHTIKSGELPRKRNPYVIPHKEATQVLFILALESAMRLREMYTLSVSQVDFSQRTVFLDKTKNGDKRQVPLSSVAMSELRAFIGDKEGDALVFPYWDGDTSTKALKTMSDYLSKLYKDIFQTSGCVGLTFHDLRHEATSRLFERTKMAEAKVMKITGHKSTRMLLRYANLRGSALAEEMW